MQAIIVFYQLKCIAQLHWRRTLVQYFFTQLLCQRSLLVRRPTTAKDSSFIQNCYRLSSPSGDRGLTCSQPRHHAHPHFNRSFINIKYRRMHTACYSFCFIAGA